MYCHFCGSKAVERKVFWNHEWEYNAQLGGHCHSCGAKWLFCKYRRNKYLERGRGIHKGPISYWSSRVLDYEVLILEEGGKKCQKSS